MAELKPGWQWVKFGDVVRLGKERCADPVAEGIERYIGLEHIEPGDLRVRSWGEVAEGTTFTTRVRPGHVIFGKRRAYQRKVAVADFDAVCSGDIYVFESANPERLLPALLPFLCQTDAFFDHAVGTSAGSLSPRTNWTSLAEYEFALPPLEEQRRIGAKLQSMDGVLFAIGAAGAAIKQLSDAFDEKFFSSAPEAWPRLPVSTLCDFNSRRHEASDKRFDVPADAPGAVPVLRSLNVWPGRFDLTELRHLSPEGNMAQSKLQLRENDVLIVRTGDAGRPGNAAVVPKSMEGWNCLDIILARPKVYIAAGYLEAALNRPSSLQRLTSLAPGTKQKHLTMTELHRLVIPVPPLHDQLSYLEERSAIGSAAGNIQLRRTAASQLKLTLLQSLEATLVH